MLYDCSGLSTRDRPEKLGALAAVGTVVLISPLIKPERVTKLRKI